MNDTTQTPVASLTLRERIAAIWQGLGNAWERLRTKVFIWRHTGNQSALTALCWLALAAVMLAVVLVSTCSEAPRLAQKPITEQPAAVQTNPLAPLVARIEAVEEQVADLQDRQPAAAPRPAVRRAPATAAAAPAVPAAPSEATAPPLPAPQPPAPITRQTVDQFRASLRTTLPNQE